MRWTRIGSRPACRRVKPPGVTVAGGMDEGQSLRGHGGSGNDDVRLCRCGLLRARRVPGGMTADAGFTGGHLIYLAAAGCVLDETSAGKPPGRALNGWGFA
jgi:hypothetical protein